MTTLSTEAADLGWLLDNFVRTVPGTRHALVVSADGLLMAMLVSRAEGTLTPQLITEMRDRLPVDGATRPV